MFRWVRLARQRDRAPGPADDRGRLSSAAVHAPPTDRDAPAAQSPAVRGPHSTIEPELAGEDADGTPCCLCLSATNKESRGLSCGPRQTGPHFVCDECFDRYVLWLSRGSAERLFEGEMEALLGRNGRVFCPLAPRACVSSSPFSDRAVALHIHEDPFELYLRRQRELQRAYPQWDGGNGPALLAQVRYQLSLS